MSWAFWLGTTLFVVAVGGLLYLRDRPLHDVDGTLVDDEDGHRVATDARLERVVLTELLDADHAPRTASELRRRLRLSVTTFYGLMAQLVRDGLVQARTCRTSHTTLDELLWSYRLTDRGLARALQRPTSG